jgi:hypothetical protein
MGSIQTPHPAGLHQPPADAARSGALKYLVYATAALALWIFISTVYIVGVGWVPIPVTDDWDRWITYVNFHYTPQWFFREHVDHRLAAPNVFFALDHLLFHGRGWFLDICSLGFQALTGVMLWRLSRKAYPQGRLETILLASATAAFIFSAQQWMNFVQPFQIQFPLVYCLALAALFAVYRSASLQSRAWFIAAIALACIASYSMANGILTWPLLLILAWWLGIPRRWLGAIAACGLVIGIAYFYGWEDFVLSAKLTIMQRIGRALVFWFGLLGSPVMPLAYTRPDVENRIIFAVIAGLLLLITFLAGLLIMWRQGRPIATSEYNPARCTLILFAAFLAGSAALISYGRSPGSMTEIFTWRYQTPSNLFWAAMLLAAWPLLRRLVPRVALYAAVCLFVYLGISMHQRAVLADVRTDVNGQRRGEIAVVDNVMDPDAWSNLFHAPELTLSTIDFLKQQHLMVFTEEWANLPGTPLQPRFAIDRDPNACQGMVDIPKTIVSTRLPGWQITGWAWDKRAMLSPHHLVIADETGRIAGVALGRFPLDGSPAAAVPADTGFNGYVRGTFKSVTVYLVEYDDHSICPVGTQKLQQFKEFTFDRLGAPLPEAPPEIAGAWVPNGYWKGPGTPGMPDSGGPVFGSFPDANMGSIRLGPFHLDGHTQIAIPIVTGPASRGLSVVVRDAVTKQIYSQLTPPPVREAWWAWNPDIPTGRELSLEIFAEDKGSGWGQWLALAWPHQIR